MELENQKELFAQEVRAGLTGSPKRLPCHYFYDQKGSHLFEEICKLPEYYLTRSEAEILENHATQIAEHCPPDGALVELGSGSALKTRFLLEAFLSRNNHLHYMPIDIDPDILDESSTQLLREYPTLQITAFAGEYRQGLHDIKTQKNGSKLILWLGSSIGNLDFKQSVSFLRSISEEMFAEDRFLLGVDLHKDRETLEKAYNDSRGVTAEFNLNLLDRINRQLGGHFDLETFRHRAPYNGEHKRIEMYLESTKEQMVAIDGLNLDVHFVAGGSIHTENCHKLTLEDIDKLAESAGFAIQEQWFDSKKRFSLNLLKPGI